MTNTNNTNISTQTKPYSEYVTIYLKQTNLK